MRRNGWLWIPLAVSMLVSGRAQGQHEHPAMPMGQPMRAMEHPMTGLLGPYPMEREASGTSWQPDAGRDHGLHAMRGGWVFMLHGAIALVSDHQGGSRGADDVYSSNDLMLMGMHPAGPGTFGFRTMLSIEPGTIGTEGYPLLLQTGETADGRTPLIDRQHPHDLFMELAASYAWNWSEHGSLFFYAGLPGEPALGPPVFMHRFTGEDQATAPITHHWLDSSHITYGVTTLGWTLRQSKLEVSAFRGREPDEQRWGIESPKLDSWSVRGSQNLGRSWAMQASFGHLASPEQLEPAVDQDRTTASVVYLRPLQNGRWETLLAWGQDWPRPGPRLDAWLLESALAFAGRHLLYARGERVEKDDLFAPGSPLHGEVFLVGEATLGYVVDFLQRPHLGVGIGAQGSLSFVPQRLEPAYGKTPASGALFVRARLE